MADVLVAAGWAAIFAGFVWVAWRKGKLRWPYIALTLVAPPLGILAVLLSRSEGDAPRPAGPPLAAKLTVGLLPLWLSIAIVWAGSLASDRPNEYWNVAPWLVILGIPASFVTLLLLHLFWKGKAVVPAED